MRDVGEGLCGGERRNLRRHPRLHRVGDGQGRVDRDYLRVDLEVVVVVVAGADAVGPVVAGGAVETAEVPAKESRKKVSAAKDEEKTFATQRADTGKLCLTGSRGRLV